MSNAEPIIKLSNSAVNQSRRLDSSPMESHRLISRTAAGNLVYQSRGINGESEKQKSFGIERHSKCRLVTSAPGPRDAHAKS